AIRARMRELGLGDLHKPTTAEELLRRPEVDWAALVAIAGLPELPEGAGEQIEIDVKYAGYVAQAARQAAAAARLDALRIPRDLDWSDVPSLSAECRERLARARPETIGQVSRLPGVTPAAVDLVVAYVARGG